MDLKELSNRDLKELKTKLELEILKREKPNMKRLEIFYHSLDLLLKNKNIKSMPYQVFKKTSSNWTLFENTFKVFDGYISDNCDTNLIVEWFTIYNFFFGMVLDTMKERDVILTTHSILSYAQYLPGIIDSGFPGWVSSGMFPLIIKLIIKKEEKDEEDKS